MLARLIEFIVIYTTDDGNRSFVEFETREAAHRWCEGAIVTGTARCDLHWVGKTERFTVKHVREMVAGLVTKNPDSLEST